MIGTSEVKKAAADSNFDAQTLEHDYVLAHVAAGISDVAGQQLVLKGGTSLRLAHLSEYRFSADLDYSAAGIDAEQAKQLISRALAVVKERVGFPALDLVEEAHSLSMQYVGPLGARARSIKLDISTDEVVIEPERRHLTVSWRDLDAARELCVYSLREVCAEKMRCVIQRLQCRDLYDMWVLVEREQSVELAEAWPLFETKARSKGFDPMAFFESWTKRGEPYERNWLGELSRYIGGEIPAIETVLRQMNRRVAVLKASVQGKRAR